jgi:NAD-dependent SIR2 family protein deacetylase
MNKARWIAENSERLLVLTGAGVSLASGLPVYRNERMETINRQPIMHAQFVGDSRARARYWLRSYFGVARLLNAKPNEIHHVLGALGRPLITQNVDRLHTLASINHDSHTIVELHGRIDRVRCLQCSHTLDRRRFQRELERLNEPLLQSIDPNRNESLLRSVYLSRDADGARATSKPDGDAAIEPSDGQIDAFREPQCSQCAGTMKPDVVFYGDTVPRAVAQQADALVDDADALLVCGTTLSTLSAFRLVRRAHLADKPVLFVNKGAGNVRTLPSHALHHVDADAAQVLRELFG